MTSDVPILLSRIGNEAETNSLVNNSDGISSHKVGWEFELSITFPIIREAEL